MDSTEDIDRQRVEWEAYEFKELSKGRCPYSGYTMLPVMDVWNRRMLMCGVCDCFGYPLVMSDAGEEYGRITKPHLTTGELDW